MKTRFATVMLGTSVLLCSWPACAVAQAPAGNKQQILLKNGGQLLPLSEDPVKEMVWRRENGTTKFYVYVIKAKCEESKASQLSARKTNEPLEVLEPVNGKVTCTFVDPNNEEDFKYYLDPVLYTIQGPQPASRNAASLTRGTTASKLKVYTYPKRGPFSAHVGGCGNCVR